MPDCLHTHSLYSIHAGHPSRHDVPSTPRVRIHDALLPADHQEDLDEPAPLGGLHPLRETHRARKLRRAPAAAQGAAARGRREAAEPQGRAPRVRRQEGHEQGSRRRLPRHLRRGRLRERERERQRERKSCPGPGAGPESGHDAPARSSAAPRRPATDGGPCVLVAVWFTDLVLA